MNYSIVENALRYQCSRVQFCKLFLTRQMIDTARENGDHLQPVLVRRSKGGEAVL